jgi:hypothetical protein
MCLTNQLSDFVPESFCDLHANQFIVAGCPSDKEMGIDSRCTAEHMQGLDVDEMQYEEKVG